MNKLIVSLTFDDALDCHLDTAMPALEASGLAGTFFVNLNADSLVNRWQEWSVAHSRGHELGNHTIFHPAVSSKSYITAGNALENYTLDRMRLEIETANRWLAALDGCERRTFAYPCSNPMLGRPGWSKRLLTRLGLERTRMMGWLHSYPRLDVGSTETDYSSLLPELFASARGGGFPCGKIGPISESQRYKVPCVSADGLDEAVLTSSLEEAAACGNWLVLMFHGIGGGHRLSCDVPVFNSLLRRLQRDSACIVMTFQDASRRFFLD